MFINIKIIDNNITVLHIYVLNEADLSKERVIIIVDYIYTFLIVIVFPSRNSTLFSFKILHIEMKYLHKLKYRILDW